MCHIRPDNLDQMQTRINSDIFYEGLIHMHFLSRYLQLSFEMSHSKINLLTERLRHPQTRNFVPAPKPAPRPPRALLSGPSDAQPKQRKPPAPKRGSRKRKADVGSPPATKKKQKTKSQDKGKGKANEACLASMS